MRRYGKIISKAGEAAKERLEEIGDGAQKVRSITKNAALKAGRKTKAAATNAIGWAKGNGEAVVGAVNVTDLVKCLDELRGRSQNYLGEVGGYKWADKAMDARFRSGEFLGPLHRLFDHNHTVVGATQAVFSEAGSRGLDHWQAVKGLGAGLWNDFDTKRGIPYVTLSKEYVEECRALLHEIGINDATRTAISDFFSINSVHALTYSLSAVSVILVLKQDDQEKIRQRISSMALYGAMNNHFLAVLAFPLLLKSIIDIALEIKSSERSLEYQGDVKPFLKGGAAAGAGLAASAAALSLGGPVLVPILASIIFSSLVGGYWDNAERLSMEWGAKLADLVSSQSDGALVPA